MVAKKNKMPKQKRRRAPRRKAQKKGPNVLEHYARALQDPCQGPLLSVYPGERGVIGRYVIDQSYTIGGTDTAMVGAWWPALNGSFLNSVTNGGTAASTSFSVGAGSSAGQSVISAAFGKSRPIASCIEVSFPSTSQLNMVGEMALGCVSASTVLVLNTNSITLTPNDVFNIVPHRQILQRKVYEQKFSPGNFDSRYTVPFDFSSQDATDSNILLIAIRGVPAGTQISLKWTLVIEATAKRLSGLATSAINIRPGSHDTASNVAAAMHAKHPGWDHIAKNAVGGFLGGFAPALGKYAGSLLNSSTTTGSFTQAAYTSVPIIEEVVEAEAAGSLLML